MWPRSSSSLGSYSAADDDAQSKLTTVSASSRSDEARSDEAKDGPGIGLVERVLPPPPRPSVRLGDGVAPLIGELSHSHREAIARKYGRLLDRLTPSRSRQPRWLPTCHLITPAWRCRSTSSHASSPGWTHLAPQQAGVSRRGVCARSWVVPLAPEPLRSVYQRRPSSGAWETERWVLGAGAACWVYRSL